MNEETLIAENQRLLKLYQKMNAAQSALLYSFIMTVETGQPVACTDEPLSETDALKFVGVLNAWLSSNKLNIKLVQDD